MKNGRCSRKNNSKAVRFTCDDLPLLDRSRDWQSNPTWCRWSTQSWRQAQHRLLKIFPLRTDCLLPFESLGLGNHIGLYLHRFCGLIPLMPCSSPIRWTYPAYRAAECVASASFLAIAEKSALQLKAHMCASSFMAKRNWLNGFWFQRSSPRHRAGFVPHQMGSELASQSSPLLKHIHRSLRPIPSVVEKAGSFIVITIDVNLHPIPAIKTIPRPPPQFLGSGS